MAVKPVEGGGTFDPAAARAKQQQLMSTRGQEAAAAMSVSTGKSQSVGTSYTNSALTQEKVLVMTAKNKAIGDYLGATLLGTAQTTPNSFQGPGASNPQTKPIDRYTKNVLQTIFSPEVAAVQQSSAATDAKLAAISKSSAGQPTSSQKENDHGAAGLKEDLNKLLQPVSSFTGSTLGALPNLASTPLGATAPLGGGNMAHVLDKVNPNLTNQLDAFMKQHKSAELAHLPAQMMGSVQKLATAASAGLAVPTNLASDLYGGIMKVQQQVAQLTDKAQALVQQVFLGAQGVIDQLIPPSIIKQVTSTVGGLNLSMGQLTQLAGGFGVTANLTGQLTNFTSQAQSALNDPMSLASSYLPQMSGLTNSLNSLKSGDISGVAQQAMSKLGGGNLKGVSSITQTLGSIGGQANKLGDALSVLRDGSQMLSKLVPPELLSQMGKISQMPGLGSVGNLGYGLGPVLESLKPAVISQTLSQFSAQAGILGPLLNVQNAPPLYPTDAPREVAIKTAAVNPSIPTAHGVPIQTTPRTAIFEQSA
jgi:hypothetical protein